MITHEVVEVLPADAQAMLDNLYPRQRPVTDGHVSRLAEDIRTGEFRLSPDPIVLLADGRLANGQHRLRACVETGIPITVVISRGWEESVYDIMDAGMRRKLLHRVEQSWLKAKNAIAAIRGALNGPSPRNGGVVTEQAVVRAAIAWEAQVRELVAMPYANKLRGPILSVALRALLRGENGSHIARFIAVVGSGVGSGEQESAAVRLFVHTSDSKVKAMGGLTGTTDLYRRTQSALRAFLDVRPLSKLYACSDDLWPLKTHEESAVEQQRRSPEF